VGIRNPGAKIDKVFNTLVDSSIQLLSAGTSTSGPGVSNLVTGLATANTEGDPVIALGGAVPG
jgi:acetolactate synthase-1/2/3 large subunit